ncbi:hypothetical protein BIW11_04518, partial [Tropilaelaps mercedesae]
MTSRAGQHNRVMAQFVGMISWLAVMNSPVKGVFNRRDLLNLESIQISNALLQEFQDIDEVRIMEIPQSDSHAFMESSGPGRVRTFAGLVYRKPGKGLANSIQASAPPWHAQSLSKSIAQESKRQPFVTTSDQEQMMLVNLSAILGVPNLGIARVPLKILNSHKYQGRKWVAVPTARVQTKNNLAGFPISPPEMNSIDVQPAYTRYAHSQALQKPTSSSSANVNVSNIHATKTSTQSYTTNQ